MFILDKGENYGEKVEVPAPAGGTRVLFGRPCAVLLLANFTGEPAKHFPEKFAGGPRDWSDRSLE